MLDGIQTLIGGIGEDVGAFVAEKPLVTAGIGAGVVGATIIGVGLAVKKKAKKKTKAKTKKGRSRDRKFKSKQKHEQKYKRKKKYKVYGKKGYIKPKKASSKKTKKKVGKIYFTKKGQPYKIMASGKARFVKKGVKR